MFAIVVYNNIRNLETRFLRQNRPPLILESEKQLDFEIWHNSLPIPQYGTW